MVNFELELLKLNLMFDLVNNLTIFKDQEEMKYLNQKLDLANFQDIRKKLEKMPEIGTMYTTIRNRLIESIPNYVGLKLNLKKKYIDQFTFSFNEDIGTFNFTIKLKKDSENLKIEILESLKDYNTTEMSLFYNVVLDYNIADV